MSIPGIPILTVDIDTKQLEEGALRIISTVRPEWKQGDIVFKIFTDGASNQLVGCRLREDPDNTDMVLVRVFGTGTETFVDRVIEMLTIHILSKSGRSKPLYARFINGISYGFMPGECLDLESVREEHIGSLVAQEIVRMEGTDLSSYVDELPAELHEKLTDKKPFIFDKMRTFLNAAELHKPWGNNIETMSDTELGAEVNKLEKELSVLGSPAVFCHNDVLPNNIVYNKGEDRCYLIDFEFSAFNYQAYDIGSHFCEWAGVVSADYNLYPGKEKQIIWLKHFLRAYKQSREDSICEPTDKELETLYVQANKFALAAHLVGGIWALAQARHSTIDFDYHGYSQVRLKEYFRRKEEFLGLRLP